jgi:hypothetical protein
MNICGLHWAGRAKSNLQKIINLLARQQIRLDLYVESKLFTLLSWEGENDVVNMLSVLQRLTARLAVPVQPQMRDLFL